MTPDDAIEPAFEAQLASGADEAVRCDYAEWLDARGAHERAAALRRYNPAPPIPLMNLVFEEDAELSAPTYFPAPDHPFHILVIDDFLGQPDPRPLGDRLKTFPNALAGLAADEQNARANGLKKATDVPQERRSWRALRWLMRWWGPGMQIDTLNATAADLLFDLEDAPSLWKSDVSRTVNQLNHPGMEPCMAVVLGFALDRVADASLLERLAQLGREKCLPFLVPTRERFEAEALDAEGFSREGADARYLALCAPDFVIERTPERTLLGPASFLLAGRLAASWTLHGGGGDLRGRTPFELTRPISCSQSILARERGALCFVNDGPGARLIDDATFGAQPSPSQRSLSWLFFAQRFALQALRVHLRQQGPALCGLSAAEMAALLERGLASRMHAVPGVSIALQGARWTDPPTASDGWLDFGGVMEVELVSTIGREGAASIVTREPISLRLGP